MKTIPLTFTLIAIASSNLCAKEAPLPNSILMGLI